MTADARTAALVAELRRLDRRLKDVAEKATPGPWSAESEYRPLLGCRCLSCYEDEPYAKAIHEIDTQGEDCSPILKPADAEHIAANHPQAVLDDIEGRERIYRGWEAAAAQLAEWHTPGVVPTTLHAKLRVWRLAIEACAYRWRHDLDPTLLPVWDGMEDL